MTKQKKTVQTNQMDEQGVFVYLGPSIRGVIQSGTIYRGTRQHIKDNLQYAIEKYPHIDTLIVADTDIADAKAKIKKGGNAISHAYKALTERK